MTNSGLGAKSNVLEHVYAVSYALLRVAQVVKLGELSSALSQRGASILNKYFDEKYQEVDAEITAATYLLRMAGDVGFVSPSNVEFILKEVNILKAAIGGIKPVIRQNAAIVPDLDLRAPKREPIEIPIDITEDGDDDEISGSLDSDGPSDDDLAGLEDEADGFVEEFKPKNGRPMVISAGERFAAMNNSDIRQKTIVEKIRQSGNCRVREIQEIFPELSERTLRYDLQKLSDQGLIERIGNGGPASFYRIKSGNRKQANYPMDMELSVAEGRL